MSNKRPVICYCLYTDWETDQRKHFLKEVIKITSEWSNAVLIQQPVSFLIHPFTRFRKFLGYFLGEYKLRKSDNGAFIFTPKIFFHHTLWHRSKLVSKIDLTLYRYQFGKFINKYFPDNFILLWLFHNRLFPLTKELKNDFIVYDYQDNYDYLTGGIWSDIDAKLNEFLIKKSGLVICSGRVMFERAIKLNPNTIYLPNGNDFDELNSYEDNNSTQEIDNIDKPIIGYLGNVRDWIDFDLMYQLVSELTDVHFLFIGKRDRHCRREFTDLLKYGNVSWISYMEQRLAAAYVNKFKAGLIPFKIDKVTEGVFPNKFFEYLALGVPVVCTNLPDLEKYSDIIGYARNNKEFINYCKSAINGEFNKYKNAYIKLAKENTWEKNAVIVNDILRRIL